MREGRVGTCPRTPYRLEHAIASGKPNVGTRYPGGCQGRADNPGGWFNTKVDFSKKVPIPAPLTEKRNYLNSKNNHSGKKEKKIAGAEEQPAQTVIAGQVNIQEQP